MHATGSLNLIHLDDFLFMGLPKSVEYNDLLSAFQYICQIFGAPLGQEKNKHTFKYLHRIFRKNSTQMEFHLPEENIYKIQQVMLALLREKKI